MNKKNIFVKVLDDAKADELIAAGFKCVKETMNNKIVHSFFVSEELVSYLNTNFDKKDFLLSNKLNF